MTKNLQSRVFGRWNALAGILILGTCLHAEEAAPSIVAKLQPFVVDNHSLAGAVTLFANKEKILSLEAVGFADIAANKKMSTDAIFWIASQSKPITTTALMMLVDEGKVNVEDPVEKYLPEFTGQQLMDKDHKTLRAPARPIAVRDILSHTSGLPFSSPMERPTLDLEPLSERVNTHLQNNCAL